MRLLILVLALMQVAATTWQESCDAVGLLATNVMSARQSGLPMSEMIKIAGDNPIAEELVVSAFKESRYSTESVQQRTIANFRDQAYLECAQALRK